MIIETLNTDYCFISKYGGYHRRIAEEILCVFELQNRNDILKSVIDLTFVLFDGVCRRSKYINKQQERANRPVLTQNPKT